MSAIARDSSEGLFLRDALLRCVELRLLFELALPEDLAARLRRWVDLRALLLATWEPPVGRL